MIIKENLSLKDNIAINTLLILFKNININNIKDYENNRDKISEYCKISYLIAELMIENRYSKN